ncbi:DUF945 family protein [Variovorax sp. J22G21]|uniref:YdgA family protein n=1 Tax=Variovorax fucosicus TaxID=3053517 RepID=UPI002576A5A8|nr:MULTISPECIES: DUF945 family protein [unclassified Variovorax]MDM0037444.1 DUF945 family protein [Variovorax sp. J22R193]MDM0062220.1 DUF945 family protein [Variovorax sp. J22G21]
MKKAAVAAALVVLVGGAYLGATAYTGHRIAAAYDARVAKLEQQLPFLRVVDRQTDKGLFSSTYSGSVRIGCVPDAAGGKAGKPLLIGFRDQVRHGPLPGFAGFGAAVIESQIVLPDEVPEPLRKYLAGMKPQDIRTAVGYGGDYKTALRLPAGDYALPAGQLSWPEVHATGSGRLDASASAFEGHLPEIAFRGTDNADAKGLNFKLVNLRWQGANKGEGNFWLRPGTSSMEIERLELLGDSGGKAISAQVGKIKYLTELGADKDLLNAKATITADATLQIGADAKPIQLDNIEFQESIKRLHGPTLQKVLDASMAELSTCGAGGEPAVDSAARGQEMLRMLAQLLPYAPEISVDKLALSYEGQRGELSYAVSAPGLTAKDIEAPGALQGKLQQNLVLRADAKLPVAWVEQLGTRGGDAAGAAQRVAQANTMLDLAIGKGFVVRDGDHVTSKVLVERGAILINDKPFGGR